MVKITIFIQFESVTFELPNVTKKQAVDVIESLEIELLNLFDKLNFKFIDGEGNERFVCLDESLPANIDDVTTNEPVLFSGLLGSHFEYSIRIE